MSAGGDTGQPVPRLPFGAYASGVPFSEMPEAQAKAIQEIVADLRPEERRNVYRVVLVEDWRAPWPSGTVHFTDAEQRVWYIRPDGTYTWRT